MVPKRDPYGVKCPVSRANDLFIHSYLSSQLGALPRNKVKTYTRMFTVYGAPRRLTAYIKWSAAWFPKGMRMRVACWITKTRMTYSEYAITIGSPRGQWLRYTYIACLVCIFISPWSYALQIHYCVMSYDDFGDGKLVLPVKQIIP
jgi:hypothetical protein